jgi:hypothetical protein
MRENTIDFQETSRPDPRRHPPQTSLRSHRNRLRGLDPPLLLCHRKRHPAEVGAPDDVPSGWPSFSTAPASAFRGLDPRDVRTTMIYTHVLPRGGLAVRSPLDRSPEINP